MATTRTPAPRNGAVKAPQDRKPKASDGFTFEHAGKTYTLPSAAGAIEKVDGRTVRDAFLNGQEGQMALSFKALEAVEPDPGALDALYAKPAGETLAIVSEWFQSSKDASGATLPQS